MAVNPRTGIIAVVLALLLAIPMAGSAFAKPIMIDSFDNDTGAMITAALGEAPEGRQANMGWFVSQFSQSTKAAFSELSGEQKALLEELALPEDANHGQMVSTFVHWLKDQQAVDTDDTVDTDETTETEKTHGKKVKADKVKAAKVKADKVKSRPGRRRGCGLSRMRTSMTSKRTSMTSKRTTDRR